MAKTMIKFQITQKRLCLRKNRRSLRDLEAAPFSVLRDNKIKWLKGHIKDKESDLLPKQLTKTESSFTQIVARKHSSISSSARRRNKDFNLSRNDVAKLLLEPNCYYSNCTLNDEDKLSPYYRTIDRLDCEKGYIKGNVVACSKLANDLKNHLFEIPSRDLGVNIKFYENVIKTMKKEMSVFHRLRNYFNI